MVIKKALTQLKRPRSLVLVVLLTMFFVSFFAPEYKANTLNQPYDSMVLPKHVLTRFPATTHVPYTKEALQDFIQSEHEAIRLKVQITKDNNFIAYPSGALQDYTDADESIRDKTLKDLECVNLVIDNEKTPYRLLDVDEALSMINGQKKVFLQVLTNQYFAKDSAVRLAALIRKHRAHDFVVIEALNPYFLYALRKIDPDIVIQYDLLTPNHKRFIGLKHEFTDVSWIYQWHWLQKQMMRLIQPDLLAIHYTAEKHIIKDLLAKAYPIYIWGANDSDIIQSYLDARVVGYQSDYALENIPSNPSVFLPLSVEELQALVIEAYQQQKSIHVLSTPSAAVIPNAINIQVNRLKGILYEQETQTLVVEAGVTFKEIQEYLIQLGRTLPVYPNHSNMTVLQAIQENRPGIGFDRQTIGEQLVGLTLQYPNGKIIQCSLTENDTLFHSAIGGLGVGAIVQQARFKTTDNLHLSYLDNQTDTEEPAVVWYESYGKQVAQFADLELISLKINQPIELSFDLIRPNQKQLFFMKQSLYFDESKSLWRHYLSHILRLATQKDKASLNEMAYFWRAPIIKINQPAKLYEGIFSVPMQSKEKWIKALDQHLADWDDCQLISLTAVHQQKTQQAMLSLLQTPAIVTQVIWKLNNPSQKNMQLFHEMLMSLNNELLDLHGRFHLQNQYYTEEQLKRAYPEFNQFMQTVRKTDPEKRIICDYPVIMQQT